VLVLYEDKAGIASSLNQPGSLAYVQGVYGEALALFSESLDTCLYLLALFECGYVPGLNAEEGQLCAIYKLRQP
jgi:hypothetical protein